MRRKYIYIAAPYMGENTHDHRSYFRIHENIMKVHEVALEVAKLGYGFFAPHVHSAHNEVIAPELKPDYWYELDNHFLKACDAVLVLPGKSQGVEKEVALAMSLNIPVFFSKYFMFANFPPFGE